MGEKSFAIHDEKREASRFMNDLEENCVEIEGGYGAAAGQKTEGGFERVTVYPRRFRYVYTLVVDQHRTNGDNR